MEQSGRTTLEQVVVAAPRGPHPSELVGPDEDLWVEAPSGRRRLVGVGAALVVLAAAAAVLVLTRPGPAPVPLAPGRPVVVVTGSGLGDEVEAGVLAHGVAARVRTVVLPGAGYAAGDGLGRAAPSAVPDPGVAAVVVQGGEQDTTQPPQVVEVAVLHLADRLRAVVSPSTSIVLVGPVPDGEPSAELLRVRDEVKAGARAKGVHFLDPVALGLRRGQFDLPEQLAAAVQPLVRG